METAANTDADTVASAEATLEVVDTHVHFWDPTRLPYPWLVEVPAIAGPHTPADLRTEAGSDRPRQIVFVQADCQAPVAEVDWVETLADSEPRIAGIVAFTPVDRGSETTMALAALCARPLVRGIRHLLQGERDPGFCLRSEFVAGVRRLGEIGLPFDLCIRAAQLPDVIELCRRCPATSFVLDHAGKPEVKVARLDPWREHIATLAELPNVVCKLSGLVTEANLETWTPRDLRPYVDHVLHCFGAERVAFGSDWPVVKLGSSYSGWLRTARALLEELSPPARAAVFRDNARLIYGLPSTLGPRGH